MVQKHLYIYLDTLFTTRVNTVYKQYVKVRLFEQTDVNEQGMELVQITDDFVTVPIHSISRKVMLFPFQQPSEEEEEEQQFIVMDFTRRVFPVNPSTLVSYEYVQ